MINFKNNNIDFLNQKLDFLNQKLADFEVAYIQVVMECIEDNNSISLVDNDIVESFYKICGEGAKIRAHIDFIKSCIDLTKIKIKEVSNA